MAFVKGKKLFYKEWVKNLQVHHFRSFIMMVDIKKCAAWGSASLTILKLIIKIQEGRTVHKHKK